MMTYLMHKHVRCYQKLYIDSNKKEKEKETIDIIAELCPDKNDIKF
jgi:hypothetical protein